jgi:hypothetical protein
MTMKTRMGEQIVCGCARPAGRFRHDVDDRDGILSDDIELFLDAGTAFDAANGRWVRPMCKMEPASRVSGDRWRARTKRGWVE